MESPSWLRQFADRVSRGKATDDDYARMARHIAEVCSQIQGGWNRREEYKRRIGTGRERVTAPVASADAMKSAAGCDVQLPA